ncbi:thioesterase II family protein [Streptomyces sp. 2MCAF27]
MRLSGVVVDVFAEHRTQGGGWIRRTRRCPDPRIRLVCLPYAGGAASSYYSWSRWLPDGVEQLVVQYPGRQDRITEPCMSRMGDLVPNIVEALRPNLGADVPLVLFGHSMGAWVAFEVALRLEISFGYQSFGLIASGQVPPHTTPEREWPTGSDDELIAELRRIGSMDVESIARPELRELVMPAIRSDFLLVKDYPPQPVRRISAPIAAYVGADDPDVPSSKAAGWEEATRGAFVSRVFPGGHFFLMEDEAQVAGELRRTFRWLARGNSAYPHLRPIAEQWAVESREGNREPVARLRGE